MALCAAPAWDDASIINSALPMCVHGQMEDTELPAHVCSQTEDTDSITFSETSGSAEVNDDIFVKGDYLPPPPGLELTTMAAQPAQQVVPESGRTPLSIKAAVYVPKALGEAAVAYAPKAYAEGAAEQTSEPTTAMMRNLPSSYSRSTLVHLLEAMGFQGQFDLVYLPMDFDSNCNFGYGFVNLVNPEQAQLFAAAFHGFSSWPGSRCRKVCAVNWAEVQGFRANFERYRRSGIMCQDILEEYKPAVFQGGLHVRLPPELPHPQVALPLSRRRRRRSHSILHAVR